jgi:hypothetical protein
MSFKKNDLIKIDFLNARPDLNDRVAKLVEFLPGRGRWHAHVLETDEHVCIKPENCFPKDECMSMDWEQPEVPRKPSSEPEDDDLGLVAKSPEPEGQRLWCIVPDQCFHSPMAAQYSSDKPMTSAAKRMMYENTFEIHEEKKKEGDEHVYLPVPSGGFLKTAKDEFIVSGYFVITSEMKDIITSIVRNTNPPGGGVHLIRNMCKSDEMSFEMAGSNGPKTKMFEEAGIKGGVNMVPHWSDNKKFKMPCAVWYVPV